jgi:pilus assembly protein TadC
MMESMSQAGIAVLAVLIWVMASVLQQKYIVREKLAEKNTPIRWFAYYALVFAVACLQAPSSNAVREFIYANF